MGKTTTQSTWLQCLKQTWSLPQATCPCLKKIGSTTWVLEMCYWHRAYAYSKHLWICRYGPVWAWSFQEETPNFSLRQYLEAVSNHINSWPLRNFLILFSGNTRDLAMQIGWFVQIWYHLVSLSLNGHRFPSSSTCHQGYRWVSFNAMVRCWVSAVKTHCQFSWPGSTWACHKLEGTWSSLFWRFTSLCANVPKRIDAGHPFRNKHPSDPSLC